MKTPDWILEGFDSRADWERAQGKKLSEKKKGKIYKLKVCPKCQSDDVKILLGGEEGRGSKGWECLKCKWAGNTIKEKELTEEEFMKYLDDKDAQEEEK